MAQILRCSQYCNIAKSLSLDLGWANSRGKSSRPLFWVLTLTRLISGMLKLLLLFLSCFSLSVKRQVWCILDGKRRDEVKSRSVGWIRTKRSLRSRRCLLTFFACFLPQTQLASLRTCIHSSSWERERHWETLTSRRRRDLRLGDFNRGASNQDHRDGKSASLQFF